MSTVASTKELHHPAFVFKAKGGGKNIMKRLNVPAGVKSVGFSSSGSYQLPNMMSWVKEALPDRNNAFNGINAGDHWGKDFAILILDNYSVHHDHGLQLVCLSKGYIPLILGGGVPSIIQVNDVAFHQHLHRHFRDATVRDHCEQLKANPEKVEYTTNIVMFSRN